MTELMPIQAYELIEKIGRQDYHVYHVIDGKNLENDNFVYIQTDIDILHTLLSVFPAHIAAQMSLDYYALSVRVGEAEILSIFGHPYPLFGSNYAHLIFDHLRPLKRSKFTNWNPVNTPRYTLINFAVGKGYKALFASSDLCEFTDHLFNDIEIDHETTDSVNFMSSEEYSDFIDNWVDDNYMIIIECEYYLECYTFSFYEAVANYLSDYHSKPAEYSTLSQLLANSRNLLGHIEEETQKIYNQIESIEQS